MKCTFCNELKENKLIYKNVNYENRILFETNNFYIIPSLGAIKKGHLLINTKKHYLSMSQIDEEKIKELEELTEIIYNIFSKKKEKLILFEHGVTKEKKSCIDHAHIHVLPSEITDIERELDPYGCSVIIDNFYELRNFQNLDYIFFQNSKKEKFVYNIPTIPSQFLRKIISEKMGNKNWNWKTNLNLELLIETYKELKPLFNNI